MQGKRIIAEQGEFADKFKASETARAIKRIMEADSFILITRTKSHNAGISCVDAKDIPFMAYSCSKMEKDLIMTGLEVLMKGFENDNEEKRN